ncbi:nucleotidyltransferase domain-containing protein [Clostridium sp. CTA-7]
MKEVTIKVYGINKKVYENLIYYFKSNVDIEKVILFGSRAKGTENINSDIDLCISYMGKSKGSIVEKIDGIFLRFSY